MSCAVIQTTSKNSQRYYTTKRLIKDLLSNMPNCYVRAGEFRGYLFTPFFLTLNPIRRLRVARKPV